MNRKEVHGHTVPEPFGAVAKVFPGKEDQVSQALTRRAVDHGRTTRVVLLDAYRDRCIDGAEFRLLLAHVDEWQHVDQAADAARALGEALDRGIGSERYRMRLVDAVFTAFDELPEPA
jgi:hypothetical protein